MVYHKENIVDGKNTMTDMTEQIEQAEQEEIAGEIIATDVSLEDYMAHYAAQHCEWIEGAVIRMAPATLEHNDLLYYLYNLFSAYFELKPLGRVVGQPFVMRTEAFPNRRREPDLLIVLDSNPSELKDTYLDGPADICIEIVSSESAKRDHGEKFIEYEQGGVPEYWIIDPLRQEARLYRLNEAGVYTRQSEDGNDYYQTPALPGLLLHVPTLWQDKLPGPVATAQFINDTLK